MQTAFGLGPDLTLLDPDQGLEIVRAAWPKVKQMEVKTGLLKTFAFSKALPSKHPKVLQVLDLGMNDKNSKVREYAAGYVEEYAGKNFKNDPKGYAAWYSANSDKDPNELLKTAEINGKSLGPAERSASKGDQPSLGGNLAVKLNQQGWQQFFAGDYPAAEETFRKILRMTPDYPAAMNGLGFALLNQGQIEEAKPLFEKYLVKQPNAAGPMNGLARCLKEEGKADDAIALWEKMCKQDPGVNAGTTALATTYSERKEFGKALPYFEKLVKAEPENEEFKKGLEAAQKGLQTK
jgi:tetratricopeptide (TPR) repeat protein